jgi:hypothetical protein
MRRNIWHLAVDLFRIKDWEDIRKKLVTHILTKNATTQCCDKWDKMKKKYFQEKIAQVLQLFHGFGLIG